MISSIGLCSRITMETKKMKEDGAISEDREREAMMEDRISELPDGIILHILSYLPTLIAVQMSVLSKRWRHMWTLVSALDFCYSRDVDHFRRGDERNTAPKRLYKFLDECLKRPYADTTITKFKLDMEFFGSSVFVDNWLCFPVNKKVEELEIQIGNRRSTYNLPRPILHIRSLTLLRLSGVALGALSTASLPSLKVLYFYDVEMDDETLNSMVSGSPSLEKLYINRCSGLLDPQVSSLSLKSMVFRPGRHCRSINVEAMNLRSFEYGCRYVRGMNNCSINMVCCLEIRNLTLHDAYLTDRWLEDLISQLPFLECLSLDDCCGLRCMKICNQHLKEFEFTSNRQLKLLEATIDTPSLVCFRYSGCSMFKISVNTPNLINANIEVSDYGRKTYDNEWYVNLIEFLLEFNGCKNVHIYCSSKKALIIPDELRKILRPPLPDLKYLKVNAGGGPMYKRKIFRKSLLWIAPSVDTLLIK